MTRRIVSAGCVVWAVVGLTIAAYGWPQVNDDARLLVGSAIVIGVGAAVAAAVLAGRGAGRWAGLCLVISVITPTWFAVVVNLAPLVVGFLLLSGRLRLTD